MFSQVSVCPQTGGVHPPRQTPSGEKPSFGQTPSPQADSPPWADNPLGRHPLGKHPLGRHPQVDSSLGRHSQGDTPQADTPLGRHPPSPNQTATAAVGTLHTGMHSCFQWYHRLINWWIYHRRYCLFLLRLWYISLTSRNL